VYRFFQKRKLSVQIHHVVRQKARKLLAERLIERIEHAFRAGKGFGDRTVVHALGRKRRIFIDYGDSCVKIIRKKLPGPLEVCRIALDFCQNAFDADRYALYFFAGFGNLYLLAERTDVGKLSPAFL